MAQFAIPIAIALVATAAVFILTKPAGQNQRGPRIGDLKVTDSAYGKSIPILRGMGRVGGNIIQASDLREIAHTKKVSGGKGGGSSSKQTSYTAEVDFAMVIGEGEIDKILRIWFDGKIVYDITGTEGLVKKPGLNFRFYPGSETQLPDPLIEALVGEDLAPAYRGTAYIVFDKLQLADYGNRPPQVTVEYAELSTPLQLYKELQGEPGFVSISQSQALGINDDTRKGYYLSFATPSFTNNLENTLLVEFDLDSMIVTRSRLLSDIFEDNNFTANSISVDQYLGVGKYDNRMYLGLNGFHGSTNPNNPALHMIAAIDLTTFGSDPSSSIFSGDVDDVIAITFDSSWSFDSQPLYDDAFILLTHRSSMLQVQTFSLLGEEVIFNVFVSPNNTMAIVQDGLVVAVSNAVFGLPFSQWRQTFATIGEIGTNASDVWLVVGGNQTEGYPSGSSELTTPVCIGKVTLSPDAMLGYMVTSFVTMSLSDVNSSAVAFGPQRHLVYIQADDSLLMFIETYDAFTVPGYVDPDTRKLFAVKWNDGVIWSKEVPAINISTSLSGSGDPLVQQLTNLSPTALGQIFQYTSGTGSVIELNIVDGSYNTLGFTAAGTFSEFAVSQYNAPAEESIITRSSLGLVKIYLNRAGGANVPVADIVRQLSLRAGLTEDEFDVTGITGDDFYVGGFQATKPSSARANIEPLEVAFSFYSVESDYKIKFIPKDGAIAPVNITERFLVHNKDSELLEEKRIQELDLPAYVGITFMDQNRDYNTGTVPVRRPSNPSATMLSDNRLEIELPLVWDYVSVKRVAQRSLYSAWQERVNYKGQIAWDYLWVDPGEEINVVMDNGVQLLQRIQKQSIGADLTMEVENVSSDVATYNSTIEGVGGVTPIRKPFSQSVKSRIFILDMPLLSDTHNPAAGMSMEYYGMAGYGADDWRGAIMFKSPDNLTWTEITDTVVETVYGTLANAMPDNLEPFATDHTLELDVYMVTGEDQIASITYEQFVAGGNMAAVVKYNGEIEVIQFQTVEALGDGHFKLTDIARGRRGTNVFCGGHQTSEVFILLTTDEAIVRTIPIEEIGSPFYFRAVTLGTLFQDALITSSTTQGNDLKPYMPTHMTAEVVATDIQFNWVRNTRLGGALMDGTGTVPLSEDAELYDLEIYSAPGGTLKRTFSGLTSPTKLYLNADIVTDFGSIPANITFKLYQISALVGRGLSRELTVEVL